MFHAKPSGIWALLLMALGVCAMLLGAARGEMATILKKATVVCLECIGIG